MSFHSLMMLVGALVLPASVLAQDFRGTILGVVTDSTGASVAGSIVTATNTSTNVRSRGTSEENGSYTLPFLVPGVYRVTVESAGFKTAQREDVTVALQQRVRLNWQLDPGVVSESITVTGEVPQLESSNASLGAVLSQKMITDLPQNGRNPYMLTRIAPGVMPTDTRLFTRPFDNGGTSSISINGAPGASNDMLMDGIPNADPSNTIAFIPSPEAVSEMKVQANTYDAEFGRAAGGTVNLTVRSGTNNFHGSAHEFWRNNILDANEFFNNRSGLPRAPQRFHMFGATAGGPLYIPKVYNGRNRTSSSGVGRAFASPTPALIYSRCRRCWNVAATSRNRSTPPAACWRFSIRRLHGATRIARTAFCGRPSRGIEFRPARRTRPRPS